MKTLFVKQDIPLAGTIVLFVSDKGLGKLGKLLDKKTKSTITHSIKTQEYKGEKNEVLSILSPQGTTLNRIVLIGVGKEKDLSETDLEMIGGTLYGACQKDKGIVTVLSEFAKNSCTIPLENASARIALGANLRHYRFDHYNSKLKKEAQLNKLTLAVDDIKATKKIYSELQAVGEGIYLARDLVNEPANILTPSEFAKRCKLLSKLGVKVEVLNETQMKKLGMHALLAVGQGSEQESKLVVMQWDGLKSIKGKKEAKAPIAFIGKGVCFDSGGISIKPSNNMGDMRGDMGGAACVTGLMHTLASRNAKVNAIGVVGLVENMPSGNAQRPGDIVNSMSGQTIEVLNTDAEGRLVLADALWYTQKRFKPEFMIDLATLTGAILSALGQEYAGLFSNDEILSKRLIKSGEDENEKLWAMPICDNFDKMIDTPNADMQNIGGRYAGSSTAAQFLQRFTNNTPWVHLDIAGTAMGSPKTAINQSWGSGYGVKLLNRFIQNYYESK